MNTPKHDEFNHNRSELYKLAIEQEQSMQNLIAEQKAKIVDLEQKISSLEEKLRIAENAFKFIMSQTREEGTETHCEWTLGKISGSSKKE